MSSFKRIAFIFPGQGTQYPGMARDFFECFAEARETFEEADDLLGRSLTSLILDGPSETLTQTHNSQIAIYAVGTAIGRVVRKLYGLEPFACAGLSLGEYTALTASGKISFADGLALVSERGRLMSAACEATEGTMAVVVGLDSDVVETCVREANLPRDLAIANFNCPGQIVLSGTLKGIAAGTEAVMRRGAKRVIPLQVHGAFHSPLMHSAKIALIPFIQACRIHPSSVQSVMNVPGDFVCEVEEIRKYLVEQVTCSVKWEQGIRAIESRGADAFIEFGPGQTLTGMNKRIGVKAACFAIDSVEKLGRLVNCE